MHMNNEDPCRWIMDAAKCELKSIKEGDAAKLGSGAVVHPGGIRGD